MGIKGGEEEVGEWENDHKSQEEGQLLCWNSLPFLIETNDTNLKTWLNQKERISRGKRDSLLSASIQFSQ